MVTCSLLIAGGASRPLMDLRVSVTGGVHFDLVKRVLRDIKRSGQAPEEIIQQVCNHLPVLPLSCFSYRRTAGAVGLWEPFKRCSHGPLHETSEYFWSQEALSLQMPVKQCQVD